MNKDYHSKSKTLMLSTIIYAIGNFGTKILSFLIVPLYTYYINPTDLGDYDLLISTISLLTPLITLQICDGAYVWMIRNIDESKHYITAVYKFMFSITVLSAVIILGLNSVLHIKYAYYFVMLLVFGRWQQTLQRLLRGLRNQKLFAASGIIYTTIFLLLNLLQVVVLKMGVVALFQSAIIANILSIVLILMLEPRLRQIDFQNNSFSLQREMLKFSVPLIPNQLNWWLINSSDRYIIRFFLNSAANGIYAIAYKFPSLLQLVYNIFYSAWQDMAVSDKSDDSHEFYSKVFKLYYQLSFTFLLFLIPFTKVFVRIVMSSEYRNAANFISFLYLGSVFQAFSSFYGVGYMKNNKTSQAATSSIFGAIVNAGINILLINFIGLYAAAISTFLAFLVTFIMRAIQTRNTMKIQVDWKCFSIFFTAALAISCIGAFSIMKVDIVLTIIGAVAFGFVNRKEIKHLGKVVIRRLHKKRE